MEYLLGYLTLGLVTWLYLLTKLKNETAENKAKAKEKYFAIFFVTVAIWPAMVLGSIIKKLTNAAIGA